MIKYLILMVCISVSVAVPANAQSDIHDVDFDNFTYKVGFCASDPVNRITVKDAKYSKEEDVDGYVDRLYFRVFGTTYGDLNGDGKDEAVVISVCNTGGTGNFTEAYIFSMDNGRPKQILRLDGGDRAEGGIREARIENGRLVVDTNDPGENGAACCAEVVVTRTYELKGGKLDEIGKPARRDLYPAKRITFAKGKFSETLDVDLKYETGIKRFVVGASKGQTLSVTSPSQNVRFRLVSGDAEIEEEAGSLRASLSETGDFVFEVVNSGESDISTSITVTIK